MNGRYPIWANQFDIWKPNIDRKNEKYWYSLCFAFVLAENRCVVTKFERGNPVPEAPEVYVDNPLCPINPASFWSNTLNKEIVTDPNNPAIELVRSVTELYRYWNTEFCKGQTVLNIGLKNEPYFKFFSFPDFVTPYSGLIQIRKLAEQNAFVELLNHFDEVQKKTKLVKEEIYRLLTKEFGYFI